MSLPLLLAGIVYIAARSAPVNIKSVLTGLTIVCFLYYWGSGTRLAYANYIVWQRDKMLTNRVVQRIEDRFGDLLQGPAVPLIFLGTPSRPDNPLYIREETAGASLWEWDGGNNRRILAMFQILGIDYFRVPTPGEKEKALQIAESMENWPSQKSVETDQKMIIVKFGDPTKEQLGTRENR
jgi:hypothetical protein